MSADAAASTTHIKPFWPPLLAGTALGLVLLLTFFLTGHGLGATGATTRFAAWLGVSAAPETIRVNAYLGPMVTDGNPLSSWIVWQFIGLAIGALVSAFFAGRLRVQFDGARRLGTKKRFLTALLGGTAAGFGARVSAGCTSGLGLSGAATLSISAFVFLGLFFITGLIVSRIIRGV